MNELVTNSVKYAFEGRTDRRISLLARKAGSTVTIYIDRQGGTRYTITMAVQA